jgi:hypothetical protein
MVISRKETINAKMVNIMKKIIDIISFVIMVALGRLWIEYDQDILPGAILMPAFIVVIFILMTLYFFIVKPKNIQRFSLIFSLSILPVVIMLSLYQHVIVHHDFDTVWKHTLIIWGLSCIMPFIAGFMYRIFTNILSAQK